MRFVRAGIAARLIALMSLVIGCDKVTAPASSSGPGSIVVSISTIGAKVDFDPDGYVLTLDLSVAKPAGAAGAVAFLDVAPGRHVIHIGGIIANCSTVGAADQTIDVGPGEKATASFSLSCDPNVGSVQLTTETTGSEPDLNGYFLNLPNGGRSVLVPANGTQTIGNVRVGSWAFSLAGVADNCTPDGSVQADIRYRGTTPLSFAVRCVASGGIQFTVVTKGVDLDRDGYNIELRTNQAGIIKSSVQIPFNGTSTLPGLRPGTYYVSVTDIAPNCDADLPSPRSVVVPAGSPTPVTASITCAAAAPIAFVKGDLREADIYTISSSNTDSLRLTTTFGFDGDPAWSPDGRKIAFSSDRAGIREIFVMDADGTNQIRLTVGGGYRPAWSPDGATIAYVSPRDGDDEIYVMNADGTGSKSLTANIGYDTDPTWSPDGTRIAFETDREGRLAIWTMNANGSDARRVIASPIFGDSQPAWSPDGRRIAFVRGVSPNTRELFVMNADGSALTQLTFGTTGSDPSWSPDGSKIVYGVMRTDCYSFYYDYYTCDPYVLVLRPDGTTSSLFTPIPASNPAWRP